MVILLQPGVIFRRINEGKESEQLCVMALRSCAEATSGPFTASTHSLDAVISTAMGARVLTAKVHF